LQDARADPVPAELTGRRVIVDRFQRRPFGRAAAVLAVALLAGCAKDKDAHDAALTTQSPLTSVTALPAEKSPDVAAVWADPVFKKEFVAGYGVNAEIEPRIEAEDAKTLEKIQPMMANNLPQAETTLKSLMKANSSAMLDFTLAGIQFQQDKLSEALANYQKAVAKFPSFRRAWRNIGLIHVRSGKNDDAIRAFTKMIELGGGDGYSYGLLGFAHAAKQDYQPAEASFRNALLLQPENTEWRLGLTRCVFKQGKFEDAVVLLDALLARHPEKAEFWQLQAHAYLSMKQPLKAAEDFEVVDKLGKSTVDTLQTLGDIYVNENLLDLAVSAYGRALDLDPEQPFARPFRAAEILTARGANAQAREVVAHIHQVRDKNMDDADRRKLLKLEARLSMAEGAGGDESAKVLEEIVKLDPLDGEALMLLGQHYAKANEPDRAMLYYERAESIEAFEVNARIRHAQVLVGMARYSEALPLLRRAQEIKPTENVQRYLEQVERISKTKR
jgi:tetratricopeptide (TPR) repeat protein